MKNYILLLYLCVCQLCLGADFKHDYSQTWVSKIALAHPDLKGGSIVHINFEQALELIKKTDRLTLGVPKIVYLVGWQYNGHDDKYPAFFEVNKWLKRDSDATAEESLNWLIREARQYNTFVSLHINMTDAYDDSPLWGEYVEQDLISKNSDGTLKIIGEYNQRKAYQINYRNEWEKGYTQMRIDRLLELLPELKKSATIHLDAWIVRPSEGHNESIIVEAEYQKKALLYWKAKGLDVTSEWFMDYMTGYVPLAYHFNGFTQAEYLSVPADVYTGVGLNRDLRSTDFDLGFLFGTTCYGELAWNDQQTWEETLTREFMLNCPQYFFLNRLKRESVEGTGNNRIARYSENVKVSLPDRKIWQGNRILRNENTIAIPAVWRDDSGVVIYSTDRTGKTIFDIPYLWGDTRNATLYQITTGGLQEVKKLKITGGELEIELTPGTPYYVIPDT